MYFKLIHIYYLRDSTEKVIDLLQFLSTEEEKSHNTHILHTSKSRLCHKYLNSEFTLKKYKEEKVTKVYFKTSCSHEFLHLELISKCFRRVFMFLHTCPCSKINQPPLHDLICVLRS